jgi:glycopeptide antibiotics resistance protein
LKLRKYIKDIIANTTGAAIAWIIRALKNVVNLKAVPIVAPQIAHPVNA